MLTEFSIGNYQAFSTPQRVPLKPLTLIFGPNSAGKSSLLRSLLVAQHAILNGRLSKSDAAGERHPGPYADIVRNGNTNPISFGFTVHLDGKAEEKIFELGLAWRENSSSGGLETVALSLKQNQSEVVTYSGNLSSKHLRIKNLSDELSQIMDSAKLESDTEHRLDDLVHRTIKNRLALQKNMALPGADADHYRAEDSKEDEIDLLSVLEEQHRQGKSTELGAAWMRKIKTAVDSINLTMTTQIKMVDDSVRDALTKLIYHGPIRPICDVITKAQLEEPGVAEWWSLAAEPELLAKVNVWLASDIFKTKYRLELERLFPDSTLKELLQSLSEVPNIDQLVETAFEAKLNSDEQFYESVIEPVAFDMEQNLEDEYEDKDERKSVARQNAHDAVYNDCWQLGLAHYKSLQDNSDVDEIESFLLGGLNQTLTYLRGKLETVRQRNRTKTGGGFDSAKVHFYGLTSTKGVSPSNMGIGFSQMMPLVTSAFGSENRLIAIEQPELHIHPALQTELADLFIQSAKERGNRFLIETHSEHLILRVMRRIRETNDNTLQDGKTPIRPEDVAVLYVQPGENGSEVIELPVTADGDFAVPWPGGFFAERSAELF
ncbi:MAG: AAA family ATPase [Verrucomicrobia bacterium]|nr:AAA family ATPase [Verrucomicrobiota bacterium]